VSARTRGGCGPRGAGTAQAGGRWRRAGGWRRRARACARASGASGGLTCGRHQAARARRGEQAERRAGTGARGGASARAAGEPVRNAASSGDGGRHAAHGGPAAAGGRDLGRAVRERAQQVDAERAEWEGAVQAGRGSRRRVAGGPEARRGGQRRRGSDRAACGPARASGGANTERAGATGDDVQGSCVRAGDAREPSAGAKPTASGEQTALARGRWADRSWNAAQWKQRVGSGVARRGAKAGYADARIE
jgi:hypothetical protein